MKHITYPNHCSFARTMQVVIMQSKGKSCIVNLGLHEPLASNVAIGVNKAKMAFITEAVGDSPATRISVVAYEHKEGATTQQRSGKSLHALSDLLLASVIVLRQCRLFLPIYRALMVDHQVLGYCH